MKRSNAIGANVTELHRLVRSSVLAGTILILLVSLPDFVPRWAAAALGAITILFGWMLALRTRGWGKHESTRQLDLAQHPSGMSAKEIASRLRGPWMTEASGSAYSTPQRRVRIAIETNGDWDALRYERRDPNEDSEEFAHDLLAIVGDDLCARDQLALIRALAERLTAWQARRGCEDDPVRHCLEELLHRHRKGTVQ